MTNVVPIRQGDLPQTIVDLRIALHKAALRGACAAVEDLLALVNVLATTPLGTSDEIQAALDKANETTRESLKARREILG